MPYLGSKAASGAYQAIIANMPPHDTYIETHIGGGAVMHRKPAGARSIGIDIDPNVFQKFDHKAICETHTGDAVEYLRSFNFTEAGRTLVYADPPYLHSTRTSRHRYTYEYTEQDHLELLEQLSQITSKGAAVMISGYPSELYDKLLYDWRTVEFQVMTRGGVRTEKLWLSFQSKHVNWCSYAGSDFTDRQRIKRKAERWASNYRSMPENERIAVLAALLKTHSDES